MRDMQAEKIYTDILEQLDNAAAKHTFPVFNNFNFPLAAMRIVAFRDDEEWLILFERIAYGTSEGTFLNMISAFGNFISRPGLQATIRFIEEVPRFPIWNNEQDYILNEKEFEVMVYGKAVKFSFDENDYRATYPEKYPGMNRGLRLLRLICHALGPKIYMTPSDLLERIDHNNIPELLTVTGWNHPDVYGPDSELPGSNGCFQSLARAIAYNNKDLYQCNQEINSNWYEWDETGLY